ncbi:MAG: CocE/NonD family hydrolase C-terminal non-catalytic domain-containing protein [Xanthobacteraceae bacterium]
MYAEIDHDDTNWIVVLKDVGPDVSVMSVREGERELPKNFPEREVTRGWLKASHRALDSERSRPRKPWHPLTRAAREPVVPGEINEYAVEIMATANLFRKGHRICLEITSLDLPKIKRVRRASSLQNTSPRPSPRLRADHGHRFGQFGEPQPLLRCRSGMLLPWLNGSVEVLRCAASII